MPGCSPRKQQQLNSGKKCNPARVEPLILFCLLYTLLSSTAKQDSTPEQIDDLWDMIVKYNGKIQSWKLVAWRVINTGKRVLLMYELNGTKGSATFRASCVQENGKWRIYYLALKA